MLSDLAKLIAPGIYQFTGQQHTYHSFAELGGLQIRHSHHLRRFLPGTFTIERGDKRTKERLETPEAMAQRLSSLPISALGVSASTSHPS